MLPFEDRFSRQRRLPEVGEAGQRRIEALACRVVDDPSGRIEAEYLRRAGAQVSFGGEPVPLSDPWNGALRSQPARDLALGAWRALEQIRRALGVPSGDERR